MCEKLETLTHLAKSASTHGISLQFCCNNYLFESASLVESKVKVESAALGGAVIFSDIKNIEKASCIDGHYISRITGQDVSLKKDPSQRKECACTYSRDIGNYTQKCYHKCCYCYANPDFGN